MTGDVRVRAGWKAVKFMTKLAMFGKPSQEELARMFPMHRPAFEHHSPAPEPPSRAIEATWIGHATVYLRMNGLGLVTDPVWSQRCSPMKWAGPKRIVQPPVAVKDLPQVDLVLLSHNHYDHTDEDTIVELEQQFRPTFCVPLGLHQLLLKKGIPQNRIIELGWYEGRVYHGLAGRRLVRYRSSLPIPF